MNVPRRYLVAGALILGLLALFVRDPRAASQISVDVQEMARMIEREEDHLTVEELAGMLMDGNHRLRVIDFRDSASYAEYHIPTAERKRISHILDERFSSSDTTVFYSEGGIHAAQAWMILAARGYRNVFTLKGGLNEWNERVVFPHAMPSMSPEEKERISTRAKMFGGELLEGTAKLPGTKLPLMPQRQFQKEQEKPREVC